MTLEANQTSTLPLNERVILHQTKVVSKVLKLCLRQRLSQHISGLLVSRYVPKADSSPLHHVSDIVIPHLNVFRTIMKHMILGKFDTTLVVTVNDNGLPAGIK